MFGGNSGAPVLGFLGHRGSTTKLPEPRLLGVLKGSFTDRHRAEIEGPGLDLVLRNLVGVGAVVPIYLVEQILRSQVVPALDASNG